MADPRRPPPVGRRGALLVAIAVAGALAWIVLGLDLAGLVPSEGGLRIAVDLAAAALRPAIDYEAPPPGGVSVGFLARLAGAVGWTLTYAVAALALAVPFGLALGFLAAASAWERAPRSIGLPVRAAVRLGIAGLRSIHELLWAVLLLAAMGLGSGAAVLALALPLVGTLAKVFSELIDEADPHGAEGLVAVGARSSAVFVFGRLPAALPDMAAFAFYRLECAVRTSAVLGFFGFPTLGYHLRASFEEGHHREVWTHLYALLVLVLVLETWSASLRRRFVA